MFFLNLEGNSCLVFEEGDPDFGFLVNLDFNLNHQGLKLSLKIIPSITRTIKKSKPQTHQ